MSVTNTLKIKLAMKTTIGENVLCVTFADLAIVLKNFEKKI